MTHPPKSGTLHICTGQDFWSTPAKRWVIPVNIEAVMGKGLALEYKKRCPRGYAEYVELCHDHKLRPGGCLPVWDEHGQSLMFATKDHWRDPSRLDWVEHGLGVFRQNLDTGVSVAFPALGCGLGGLEWPAVYSLMQEYLKDCVSDIYIYPPR